MNILSVFKEKFLEKVLGEHLELSYTSKIIIKACSGYSKCFPGKTPVENTWMTRKIPVESTWRTFAAELHFKNNYQGLCWVFQVFSRENTDRKHLDDAYDLNWA
ncbi:hypothetical protein KQX54_012754 [Cotesia glomerata]|uniref:Uncharacterized protein n=1 Tax=Cotesia glomerata TaxID=32391 RepID=A0AAV7IYE5_COTGL|nr:hypothetical protein KQX54_012754 [Cotesia glomerata]